MEIHLNNVTSIPVKLINCVVAPTQVTMVIKVTTADKLPYQVQEHQINLLFDTLISYRLPELNLLEAL